MGGINDFNLLQCVYILCTFSFTVYWNSTMDQCFCLRNMGVAARLMPTVVFFSVLKVNTNGCRKSALRAPIFHCAVSNRHVYITVWWKE